jgi:hypothetical protein
MPEREQQTVGHSTAPLLPDESCLGDRGVNSGWLALEKRVRLRFTGSTTAFVLATAGE